MWLPPSAGPHAICVYLSDAGQNYNTVLEAAAAARSCSGAPAANTAHLNVPRGCDNGVCHARQLCSLNFQRFPVFNILHTVDGMCVGVGVGVGVWCRVVIAGQVKHIRITVEQPSERTSARRRCWHVEP